MTMHSPTFCYLFVNYTVFLSQLSF